MAAFGGNFTNEMTEGFRLESPYSDVTNSPSKLPRESPTEEEITDRSIPLAIPSVRVNISPLCRPSPLLFLLLAPHPNYPPSQTANNHPLKIPPSSQQKSSFYNFCGHNIYVLIYCGFYHFL